MALAKKKIAVLAFVILAAAAGAYAYYRFAEISPAARSDLTLYGNVDIREVDLGFNDAGRVDSMQVEEGDTVRKGELLATLDASRYQAEVDATKAQIAAQQAVLDRLLAGSRPEEIKRARADAEAINASLANARAHLVRTEKLALDRFAPLQQLDDDRDRVNTLTAQLDSARQTLSLAIQGPREEDIAQARAQLAAEQAALALAQERLKDTRLYAMEDGIVKVRIVEPGAVVQAQTPVYTIALTDPVWVRTYVSEPDLGKVLPGMKATVFTDSAPAKAYEGWVGFISPVAEFTPKTVETPELRTSLVYRLRVYVRNPDRGLRQGMPVTVRLKIHDAEGTTPKPVRSQKPEEGTAH
jgi:HlyD family secretion protein